MSVHLRTVPWHQLHNFPDINEASSIPHTGAIASQMAVEEKHVDVGCRCKNIYTINVYFVG